MPQKTVFLVDGSGYIFRAYYAISPLSTSDGFPTNALFGFTRMLLKLLQQADSQHVAVVFDAGRETFRNELYPQYKANRDACPADLLKQMPYFRDISRALGLMVLELPGYEADDVIGTLTRRFSENGTDTVIISGDKDLMQLVRDNVSVWDTMKDERYRASEVREKLGVGPDKVVELLGLTGDTSDNVPGLKGVGPKTAVQLIEKFGDIETLLASCAKLREDSEIRNRNKIADQIESDPQIIRLSRKLVTIEDHAPVLVPCKGENVSINELTPEELYSAVERRPPLTDELSKLVERFEFASLMKDFSLGNPASLLPVEGAAHSYKTIFAQDFPAWVEKLREQREFAFDIETTALDIHEAKIVGFAFCWADDEAYYVPVAHKRAPHEQISIENFLEACAPLFRNTAVKKCGQNLKFDVSILGQYGLEVQGVAFDSMVAAYLLNPDRSGFGLTALAKDYLGRSVIEYEQVVPEGGTFADVEVDLATRYSAEDAHFAWLLKVRLHQVLEQQGLLKVLDEVEMPLISVLSYMERKGVKLDCALLARMSEEFGKELSVLEKRLYEIAGLEFNLNSPKQLAEVLFVKLGIPTKGLKKTKTGISTDSSVLEKLSAQHPLPGLILEYRTLFKLKSTYVDALPAQVSKVTGRLHTRFNQTVTATGRLSSSDPNLQNIPVQSATGRRIREAFVADAGRSLISADYSQIELRILAHMSADEVLTKAFKANEDIHACTAREVLGLGPSDEVTPELRRVGKTINFGVIYGMGGFRLGRDLGIPVSVASGYIESYFRRYAGVRAFLDAIEEEAKEKGEVRTMLGRKRVVADIDARGRDQGFVLRAAINAPIQGTAADLIKLAMCKVHARLRSEQAPVDLILQIHDELLFECDEKFTERAMTIIRGEMENVMQLNVPLKVEIGCGKNWVEAHG